MLTKMPYEDYADEWILSHIENLPEEPVLLALQYIPERVPGSGEWDDLCLLEVVFGFGYGTPSEDKELFCCRYGCGRSYGPADPLTSRLTITNATEVAKAAHERWPSFEEVRQAAQNGHCRVAYCCGAEGWQVLHSLRLPPISGGIPVNGDIL